MSLPLSTPDLRRATAAPRRVPDAERCANCGAPVPDEFCGACGERRRTPDALSLGRLAGEAFEHATSLDLRLVRTLVALVRRPGEVTRAYVAGARTRYTPPLQLFLLLNVVFFLAAPRAGVLRYGIGPEGAAAIVGWVKEPPPRPLPLVSRAMVAAARRTGLSAERFRARFNAEIESRTRSLVSAFIALLAVPLAAVYAWRRKYVAEHLVFATHYFTFVMLWVPAVLLLVAALLDWLEARGTPLPGGWTNGAVVLPLLGGLYTYLAIALRRAYGDRWWAALLRAAVVLVTFVAGATAVFYRAVMLATALLL